MTADTVRHVCREGMLIEALLAILRAVDDPEQPGETQRLADVSQIAVTTLQEFGYLTGRNDGFEAFQAAEGGPVTTNVDGDEVVR